MTLNDAINKMIMAKMPIERMQRILDKAGITEGGVMVLNDDEDPEIELDLSFLPDNESKIEHIAKAVSQHSKDPKIDWDKVSGYKAESLGALVEEPNDEVFNEELNSIVNNLPEKPVIQASNLPETKELKNRENAELEARNAEIIAKNSEVLKKLGPRPSKTDILIALGITPVASLLEGAADGIPLEQDPDNESVDTFISSTPRQRRLIDLGGVSELRSREFNQNRPKSSLLAAASRRF